MKIKVSEAEGVVLDWLVAKAQGFDVYHSAMLNGHIQHGFWVSGYYPEDLNRWIPLVQLNPSTDWSQGGPIIEREEICTKREAPCSIGYEWNTWIWTKHIAKGGSRAGGSGPTPLIAAMRCYVASKLGEEVEVPDGLT